MGLAEMVLWFPLGFVQMALREQMEERKRQKEEERKRLERLEQEDNERVQREQEELLQRFEIEREQKKRKKVRSSQNRMNCCKIQILQIYSGFWST